ncbi:BatD family protein [Lysobacter spongiae]|uniref:BatD family protein n=2 Tax=Marilutibacter spongiae TaxID=2025720 RepID=A0A7W3TL38_9GAMM|nr:BatD family protein [Lysobacter spongiae]
MLMLFATMASAAPRAWLDRDRIVLGETVTLNVEAGLLSSAPDYSPLEGDFRLSGHSSQRGFSGGTGQTSSYTLFAVALRPLRDGVLTIPALSVGNERTAPLTLVVEPAPQQTPAQARGDVFIESVPDDTRPYVQQSVGWVVRLFSAVPIVSGTLDQPAPEGASFQRVGDDAQYSRTINGRQYQIVERRFMLVPERSGPLEIPGASFEGRGTSGLFDDMFGGGRGGRLGAQVGPRTLQVQPVPDKAPQPWLPLHDLKLRYRANPAELRQGLAATLTVEAVADGATGAQMPELELPPSDGVQVFPERAQVDERFVDGRPRATVTRSFSLVPGRTGAVALSGVRMGWWDVKAGEAREARLPPLQWNVQPGAAGFDPPAATAALPSIPAGAGPSTARPGDGAIAPAESAALPLPGMQGDRAAWVAATVLFAVLWLLTLLLALHWRHQRPATPAGGPTSAHAPDARARPTPAALRKALDTGSFEDFVQVLGAMAEPPVKSVDALLERLDNPAQRRALEAMQQARWGDGDGPSARALLREAFADGPRWTVPGHAAGESILPPLYPQR